MAGTKFSICDGVARNSSDGDASTTCTSCASKCLSNRLAALTQAGLCIAFQAAPAVPAGRIGAAADPRPAVLRRLTHFEYDRTLDDLLGLDFDRRKAVGFGRVGEGNVCPRRW